MLPNLDQCAGQANLSHHVSYANPRHLLYCPMLTWVLHLRQDLLWFHIALVSSKCWGILANATQTLESVSCIQQIYLSIYLIPPITFSGGDQGMGIMERPSLFSHAHGELKVLWVIWPMPPNSPVQGCSLQRL